MVALAGGGVQAVVVAVTSVGGLVAVASGAPPSVVQVLVLLATTSLTMVLVNLVPLVKLDGYMQYALASYAQRPAIKLFWEWDEPLLTIEQLLALPRIPDIVIYQ